MAQVRIAGFRAGDSHTFKYHLPFHSPPQDAPYRALGQISRPSCVRDPGLRAPAAAGWRLSELELARGEVRSGRSREERGKRARRRGRPAGARRASVRERAAWL